MYDRCDPSSQNILTRGHAPQPNQKNVAPLQYPARGKTLTLKGVKKDNSVFERECSLSIMSTPQIWFLMLA